MKTRYNEILNERDFTVLLKNAKDTEIYDAIVVLTFTGMKVNELLALHIADFVIHKATGLFSVIITKTAEFKNGNLYIKPLKDNGIKYYALPDFYKGEFEHRCKQININKCRQSYNHDYDGFFFVHENGSMFQPSFLNKKFKSIFRNNCGITLSSIRHSIMNWFMPSDLQKIYLQPSLPHGIEDQIYIIKKHHLFTERIVRDCIIDSNKLLVSDIRVINDCLEKICLNINTLRKQIKKYANMNIGKHKDSSKDLAAFTAKKTVSDHYIVKTLQDCEDYIKTKIKNSVEKFTVEQIVEEVFEYMNKVLEKIVCLNKISLIEGEINVNQNS